MSSSKIVEFHAFLLEFLQLLNKALIRVHTFSPLFNKLKSLNTKLSCKVLDYKMDMYDNNDRYLGRVTYIFEWYFKSFHNVHDYACCWSWTTHSTVHKHYISILWLSIKCIYCCVNLICYSIIFLLFPCNWCISFCREGSLNRIYQSSRSQLQLLSFTQLHLRLENIIYQRVIFARIFKEIFAFIKCLIYKRICQRETSPDLNWIIIFNVYS